LGDDYAVLNEFQKMFEVDQAYAKEATRNIVDPRVIALVQQAEKVYMGMIVEYSLEITTEPKEAKIVIDGKEAGTTPEIIRSLSPKLLLEVMKDGFKPVKEEIFLTQAVTKKEYKLESAGRSFKISSYPVGAQIFLDGQDTGKETNAELPQVPFGAHAVKLVKESYVDWLSTVDIVEDPKPFFLDVVLIGKNYVFNKKWGDPAGKVFLKPAGIAIDGDNNFYVIDESNANYKKVGPEGTVFWSGQELRDVKMLGGIAIDAEGNIYLTDQKKHFVLKLDKNGAAVQKWGKEGSGAEDLKIPLGIAVDKNNDIYVVDSGNGRIKKYAATGRLLKTWGRQSEAASDFVLPRAVAVNQRNEVFVLDKMGIKKFTAEGEYLATIGGVGSSDGLFNNASGLCIDQSNSIYVADSGNNRVQKFDDQGNFLGKWGSLGPADGQFSFPSGLAVDSRGNVYVTDRDNNRVQMFAVGSGPGR
jgi:DNA-binding beta-propeller fold protein YncE